MPLGEERTPDAIEPIMAYRVWSVAHDGTLTSLNGGTVWLPATWMSARCSRRRHAAPQERCSCGLYAAKEPSFVLHLGPLLMPGTAATVAGRVELAGKVIEHDFGYRAERARIAEILPLPGMEAWTEAVSRRYDVPVGESMPPVSEVPLPPWLVGCGPYPGTSAPAPQTFPWASLWYLAWSVFFVVNAFRGILMHGGPHWSQWWLWPIALVSALVAAGSFLVAADGLLCFEWRPRARPTSEEGRVPLLFDRPRTY